MRKQPVSEFQSLRFLLDFEGSVVALFTVIAPVVADFTETLVY